MDFSLFADELVGHCTLRLYGSKWKDTVWSAETLADALKRTFHFLSERAFVIDAGDDEEVRVLESVDLEKVLC